MYAYFRCPSSLVEVLGKVGWVGVMGKAGQRHQGKQNGLLSRSLFVRNSFPSIGHVCLLELRMELGWEPVRSSRAQDTYPTPPIYTPSLYRAGFSLVALIFLASINAFNIFVFYFTEGNHTVSKEL